MKYKKTAFVLSLLFGITTGYTADNMFEFEQGKTKIKMTFQHEDAPKTDEKVVQEKPLQKQDVHVSGGYDPASDSIQSLEDLAQYAKTTGKYFDYNTTDGTGGTLSVVQSFENDYIIGLCYLQGFVKKMMVMKNQITQANVDITVSSTNQ